MWAVVCREISGFIWLMKIMSGFLACFLWRSCLWIQFLQELKTNACQIISTRFWKIEFFKKANTTSSYKITFNSLVIFLKREACSTLSTIFFVIYSFSHSSRCRIKNNKWKISKNWQYQTSSINTSEIKRLQLWKWSHLWRIINWPSKSINSCTLYI